MFSDNKNLKDTVKKKKKNPRFIHAPYIVENATELITNMDMKKYSTPVNNKYYSCILPEYDFFDI